MQNPAAESDFSPKRGRIWSQEVLVAPQILAGEERPRPPKCSPKIWLRLPQRDWTFQQVEIVIAYFPLPHQTNKEKKEKEE